MKLVLTLWIVGCLAVVGAGASLLSDHLWIWKYVAALAFMALWVWHTCRQRRARRAILPALTSLGEATMKQVIDRVKVDSGVWLSPSSICPYMASLEARGLVEGRWAKGNGVYPRQRLYRIIMERKTGNPVIQGPFKGPHR